MTRIPEESETVEWKQTVGEWKEIVETCAAFATAKGGTVFVQLHGRMTRKEYQGHVRTSLPTAKRDLEQMKRLGLLVQRRAGPNAYYEAGSGT